jgi:hypothetical protein
LVVATELRARHIQVGEHATFVACCYNLVPDASSHLAAKPQPESQKLTWRLSAAP